MPMPRLLGIATGGLLLAVLGAVWDMIWHQHNDNTMLGTAEVLYAHWPMLLGSVVMFVALSIAVLTVRLPGPGAGSLWAALGGSLLIMAEVVWDSIHHLQGTESAIGPAMAYTGFFLVLIGIPAAVVARRGGAQV